MRFDLKTDDAIHCPQSLLSPAAVIFTRGLNALVTSLSKMHAVNTQGDAASTVQSVSLHGKVTSRTIHVADVIII